MVLIVEKDYVFSDKSRGSKMTAPILGLLYKMLATSLGGIPYTKELLDVKLDLFKHGKVKDESLGYQNVYI